MRAIFSICLFLAVTLPALAQAGTPVTKDMANAYFNDCAARPAQNMSAENHKLMCACTAAKMMESMSVEDVKAMAGTDQNARYAINRMIINVYAPCIDFPAREHYYNTCISNPETAKMTGNPQKVCNCLGDEMAAYLKANSQSVFSDILTRNPNASDPMSALTSDENFQGFAQKKLVGCLR